MKKRNGFTLIEVLSVVIIIGIIMIIAVPAVSKYILKSDKSVYASDVSAFVETIRGKYEMKEYGDLLQDDEIMIVPIRHVILEKGDSKNSPYGEYDYSRSYIVIVPEKKGYNYYATVIDSEKVGLVNVPPNRLDESSIQIDIDDDEIPTIESFELSTATYTFNDRIYRRKDVRSIVGEDVNLGDSVYVFKYMG